ncbi:MAG: hypothetical protein SFY69_12565 [Planctomycetota bacterium]|nr:hypothetical protein [Planctomycetota bacterium]
MNDGLFEPLAAKHAALGDAEFDRLLVAAYERAGRTLDDLAYTPEFEALYGAVAGGSAGAAPTRRDVLHRLQNLRKAGKLPRLGRGASEPVKVLDEDEQTLARLVIDAVGTLGQRDRLLYDPRFDAIVQQFNARTGRSLEPHDVWRLVARLAK